MFLQNSPHRIWAEVDLAAVVHNYNTVRALAPNSQVICVVKADAYGHGAEAVACALCKAGASHFAVAAPEEALQLRQCGIQSNILLLGAAAPSWVPQLAQNNIAVMVGDLVSAHSYFNALGGKKLSVHLKIDTGMNRLGLTGPHIVDEALAIAALPGFSVDGLFSHFASADEPSQEAFTAGQMRRFCAIADTLAARGLNPPRHFANSGAVLACPDAYFDFVRPGLLLYGCNPTPHIACDLHPALSLYTRIMQVKQVPKGESVSYGCTWHAPRDTTIATVSAGYADGLFRASSGKGAMLVNGQRAPQVGRICMDICMLDVTGIDGVQVGDIATIIGQDGNASITADEVASCADTISYEVLCSIRARVPRIVAGE